jgi:peptidoglycan/xylan/chitin deacetylase (PgdA/CDA1 family)
MNPWPPLMRTVSPGGNDGRLSVFIFHRVLSEPDPLFGGGPDAASFMQMMKWIKECFNVLPLDTAVRLRSEHALPDRAASITFDDGYADNFHIARPILESLGLAATFFIATGYINGGIMWNDRVIEAIRHCRKSRLDLSSMGLGIVDLSSVNSTRRSLAELLNDIKYLDSLRRDEYVSNLVAITDTTPSNDLMMTSDQIIAMRRAGMQIGAHTVTHPILANLEPKLAFDEIADSKRFLEDLLQEQVGLFAYPNGKPDQDYRMSDVEIIRKMGFDAAVTTAWGVADGTTDPMQIPRFTPWDRTRFRFCARLFRLHLGNVVHRPAQNASR